MRISFSGGSAQQRQWVQDAVDACTYPFDNLAVDVTVTWAASTPCGTAHRYMCTQLRSPSTFLITIQSDADDPTGADASGLPDPVADVKEFYQQSFIHEIGHVAHYTLIDTDPLRAQIAALFWRYDPNSGSSKRYGTLADYSAPAAWADRIEETIAECVKCGFYTGRLIYLNRTNWTIDEANWASFVSLIAPAPRYRIADEIVAEGATPLWGIAGSERYEINDRPFPLYQPADALWPPPAGAPHAANDIGEYALVRDASLAASLHYQLYDKVTLHWDLGAWFEANPEIGLNWYGEMVTWPHWNFYDLDWVTRSPGPGQGSLEGASVPGILLPTAAGQLELTRRAGMDGSSDVGHRVSFTNLQLTIDMPGHSEGTLPVADLAALQNSVWVEYGESAAAPYPFGAAGELNSGPAPAAIHHGGIPDTGMGLMRGIL